MPTIETLIAPRLTSLAHDLPAPLKLWSVSLADPPAPAGAESVLGADERARADAFRAEPLRRRHVWCRLALRHLLGARLGCAPGAVDVLRTPEGRPFVAGAGVDFNVSNSADLALIALLDGPGRIGVDVEALVARTDMERLAARVFTSAECAEWHAAGRTLDAFYRRWTCKEAYLKALGTGLRLDPRRVFLSIVPGGAATLLQGPVVQGCTMASFAPAPGFMAAVALLSPEPAHDGIPT
jgi:4'-phosphopantetheinyl transferase